MICLSASRLLNIYSFLGLENQIIGLWVSPKINRQKYSTAYSK